MYIYLLHLKFNITTHAKLKKNIYIRKYKLFIKDNLDQVL